MPVWQSVFLHEFLDHRPHGHQAVRGTINFTRQPKIVRSSVRQTAYAALIDASNSVSYTFDHTYKNIIGIQADFLVRVPFNWPNSRIELFRVDSGAATVGITLGPVTTDNGVAVMNSRLYVSIAGESGEIGPALKLSYRQPIRLKLRWHTSGQLMAWVDGNLFAFRHSHAPGSKFDVNSIEIAPAATGAIPTRTPFRSFEHVHVKLLRDTDGSNALEHLAPAKIPELVRSSCSAKAIQTHLQAVEICREFMAGIAPVVSQDWNAGQVVGPFTATGAAAHENAKEAMRLLSEALVGSDPTASNDYLIRISSFLQSLADVDATGFKDAVEKLKTLGKNFEYECEDFPPGTLEQYREQFAPLIDVLEKTEKKIYEVSETP